MLSVWIDFGLEMRGLKMRVLQRMSMSKQQQEQRLKELCHDLRMCAKKRYILKTFANFFKFCG